MRIAVEQLTKRFGATLVLDRVDLEIREREFLGLLGPSGSGKTTLLRILAGLEFADTGRVLFDGARGAGAAHRRAPGRNGVSALRLVRAHDASSTTSRSG